jgi:hypothetical protein
MINYKLNSYLSNVKLQYILVFIATFVADIVWAKYITAVADKAAFTAGIYSMFVYLAGAYAVTKYIENKKMLIPAILGAFFGTYITVIL